MLAVTSGISSDYECSVFPCLLPALRDSSLGSLRVTKRRLSHSQLEAPVTELLAALCHQHGISPAPSLEWSSRMRVTLGRAYPDRFLIRLSAWLDRSQACETLRHELAHIVAGTGRGRPHDGRWQEWAVRLGAVPRARSLAPPALAPPPPPGLYWGLECSGCGLRIVRKRAPRRLYHVDCGPRRGMLRRMLQADRPALVAWSRDYIHAS